MTDLEKYIEHLKEEKKALGGMKPGDRWSPKKAARANEIKRQIQDASVFNKKIKNLVSFP